MICKMTSEDDFILFNYLNLLMKYKYIYEGYLSRHIWVKPSMEDIYIFSYDYNHCYLSITNNTFIILLVFFIEINEY